MLLISIMLVILDTELKGISVIGNDDETCVGMWWEDDARYLLQVVNPAACSLSHPASLRREVWFWWTRSPEVRFQPELGNLLVHSLSHVKMLTRRPIQAVVTTVFGRRCWAAWRSWTAFSFSFLTGGQSTYFHGDAGIWGPTQWPSPLQWCLHFVLLQIIASRCAKPPPTHAWS